MRRAELASEVAATWLRSGKWTPAWLAEALQHQPELQIKVGAEARHFMYAGERRPDLIGDTHACGTRRELMPARELFEAIEHHAAPPFLYFTSPLSQLPGLLEAAPGWETLPWGGALPGSETPSARGPSGAAAPWAQLWAASAGATTQAHYDVADNTFVQLSGEKEFWIWPPEVHAALHIFPDSHPRSRKAQLDPEAPDTTHHPLSAALPPPVRLLLAPGDVLRLPAFWMHHVTSRTPTVSLNLFADFCGVKAAAAEVLAVEMPLHAAWPDEVKRYGLARPTPRPPPPPRTTPHREWRGLARSAIRARAPLNPQSVLAPTLPQTLPPCQAWPRPLLAACARRHWRRPRALSATAPRLTLRAPRRRRRRRPCCRPCRRPRRRPSATPVAAAVVRAQASPRAAAARVAGTRGSAARRGCRRRAGARNTAVRFELGCRP